MLAAVSSMHVAAGAVLIALAPAPAAASWPSIAASTAAALRLLRAAVPGLPAGRPQPGLSDLARHGAGARRLRNLSHHRRVAEPRRLGGLAAISSGIGLLALQRGAAHADPRAVAVAALLGLTIAAYSVADGIGVRLAESPLGYMGWLFLLEVAGGARRSF